MSAQILKAVLSQGTSGHNGREIVLQGLTVSLFFHSLGITGILFMLKDQFERYALILMILARRAWARRV